MRFSLASESFSVGGYRQCSLFLHVAFAFSLILTETRQAGQRLHRVACFEYAEKEKKRRGNSKRWKAERQAKRQAVDSGETEAEAFFCFRRRRRFFFPDSLLSFASHFFPLSKNVSRDKRHSLRTKTVPSWSPRSAPSSPTRASRRTRWTPPGRARGPREGEMRRR